MLEFTFSSRSFLYHQVRNMVGCCVLVGRRLLTVGDVRAFLSADSIRARHDPVERDRIQRWSQVIGRNAAKPQGLYFHHVNYPYNLHTWPSYVAGQRIATSND